MSQSREDFYAGPPRLGSSRYKAGKTRKPKVHVEPPGLVDLVPAGTHGPMDPGVPSQPTYWGVKSPTPEDFSINVRQNFKENNEGTSVYICPCMLTIDRIKMGPLVLVILALGKAVAIHLLFL